MKLLILITFLISLNSYADVKIEISNIHGGSFKAKFETQLEADTWVADNLSNNSWGKPERWVKFEAQNNCLELRDVTDLVDDISIPYPEEIPEGYQHPQISIVMYQECKLPKEYSIVITDVTAEEQAKKNKEDADNARIEELKLKGKDTIKLDELYELLKLKGVI